MPNGRDGKSAPAEMQAVSRFHVIRPSASGKTARTDSDNALVERVRARARAESRKKLLRGIQVVLKDVLIFSFLTALAVGGWRLYRGRKKPRPVTVSEPAKPIAPTPSAEERQTGEAPQIRKPAGPSCPDLSHLRPADVIDPLKGARVSFYGLLPPSERLGSTEGIFTLVIPYGGPVARYYAVRSSPTGVVEVVRCNEMKGVECAESGECQLELQRQGGFLVRSGVAYYVTRRNALRVWSPPLGPGREFCASKEYFGIAHDLVKEHGWKADGLSFDIRLFFWEKEGPVPVAVARFGEKTPYAAFRKAAEPFARRIRERELPRPSLRVYKPTVVFSDGTMIGTTVNGITKIPRRPQHAQGQEYLRWRRLADEAERQEREVCAVRSENGKRMADWKRKLEAALTDEDIRKALLAASVRIVRKGGELK